MPLANRTDTSSIRQLAVLMTDPQTKDRTRIAKRSVSIAGHRTSLSLEDAFWSELKTIAAESGASLATVIEAVDAQRSTANLSSALRIFVLETLKSRMRRQETSESA